MSKDKIADYDGTTAGNNTDIGGISIAEGMLPSAVNNSMRELTKQLGAFANGTDPIDALTVTGAATVNGAFTSPGIDDNAAANAVTIDSNNVFMTGGKTSASFDNIGFQISPTATAGFTKDGATALYVNRKSSDGTIIEVRKDNTTVGSIGAVGTDVYLASPSGNDAGIRLGNNIIRPCTTTGGSRDNAIDLGKSDTRFKDLYLSGGAYLGGTGSANHLDDYEEGTFTPATTVGTISVADAAYTKVGRKVTVHFNAYSFSDRSSTNHIEFTNMPFTSDSSIGSTANSGMHRYVNAGDSLAFYMPRNQSKIQLFSLNSGSGWTPTQYSHLNSTSAEMYVHLTYFTAS